MSELDTYQEEITALCILNEVRSLFAFGSLVSNQMTPESDIDLVVDIDTNDPLEYSDNYFNLKFGLEKILNRKIDLLELKAIKNRFLKKEITQSKILVYGVQYQNSFQLPHINRFSLDFYSLKNNTIAQAMQ